MTAGSPGVGLDLPAANRSLEERSPLGRATRGIKGLIRDRGWQTGQRLPAEEALADLFRVSRSTLRKALDALSRDGVIVREKHRGCLVRDPPDPPPGLVSRALVVINDLLPAANPANAEASSAGIKQGMLDAAESLGRSAMLMPIHAIDGAMTRQLVDARPQGLVMLCWRRHSPDALRFASLFHKAGVPVAAYGLDDVHEAAARYDRVTSDHESGTRKLVERLARRGRRRILRLWIPAADTPWIAAHNRAYEAATAALGLPALPPVYVPGFPEARGDAASFELKTRQLAGYLAEHLRARHPPDALMVATDSETFHAAAACRLLGRKPGSDILITGYDNYWRTAVERQFETALPFATVDKRNDALGRELIRLLDRRIAGAAGSKPQVSAIEQDVLEIKGGTP